MEYEGKLVVEGFDWGPAVTKVVVLLNYFDKTRNFDKTEFAVREYITTEKGKEFKDRVITDVYYSDEFGNRIDYKGDYISMELKYGPNEGSPMFYDFSTGFNKWHDYLVVAKLLGGQETHLTNGKFYFPEVQGVDLRGEFVGAEGHSLTYASYKPANASEENRRPLVVWLHGMGEGGIDPLITLYGNKVTSLFGEEFQNIMDGAYILTPQTPTLWLQYEDNVASWQKNKGQDSIFLKDLKELIDSFADKNYVDKKRIIVGGCSNGGFMTMDLILNYPDYFAAAFPVCEAFYPKKLKKDRLLPLKDMPIWFVYAKNDFTVLPLKYEKPLLKRFAKIGAGSIVVSEFADVHDTSGSFNKNGRPYQYFGHFSWIYFFNNECVENGVSIWEWMSKQTK